MLDRDLGGQLDFTVRRVVAETGSPGSDGDRARGFSGVAGVDRCCDGAAVLPYQDGNRPWVRPVAQAAAGEDLDQVGAERDQPVAGLGADLEQLGPRAGSAAPSGRMRSNPT